MPRLYHPALDKTIERTDRQAEVLRTAGWITEADDFVAERDADVGGEPPATQDPAPDNDPEE